MISSYQTRNQKAEIRSHTLDKDDLDLLPKIIAQNLERELWESGSMLDLSPHSLSEICSLPIFTLLSILGCRAMWMTLAGFCPSLFSVIFFVRPARGNYIPQPKGYSFFQRMKGHEQHGFFSYMFFKNISRFYFHENKIKFSLFSLLLNRGTYFCLILQLN